MLTEVIIIILLSIALYVVLRHWPETTATRTQQLNVRKPQEERQAPTHSYTTKRTGWWRGLVTLFSDRLTKYQPVKTASKTSQGDQTKKTAKPEEASEVDILIAKAEVAQRQGDFKGSEKFLVKAATKEPKNPKIYSKLGIIYLEEGENWDEAEESFRQALKYDQGNGYVHNNLGLVLYHQDKFTAAAKEYELAITADPTISSRHVNLGLAYLALRQFGKAERSFKRAVKIDPGNKDYLSLANEAGEKRRQHRQ